MDNVTSASYQSVLSSAGEKSGGITVNIGANVTKIPAYLFSGAYYITSVNFASGSVCKSIGVEAFSYCTALTDITIPDSVTSISGNAFEDCTSLTSITIDTGVTSIGSNAFNGCTALANVNYSGTASQWASISFNNAYANPVYYAGNLYLNGGLATDITLEGITKINDYAFYGFTSLISVTIGSGVEEIGTKAFYDCYKLIEVKDLSSLTITAGSTDNGYVGYYAKNVYTSGGSSNLITQDSYVFYNDGGTYYLMGYTGSGAELTLPTTINSVTTYAIYKYAFYGNTAITSVTIGSSVTSIGNYAFSGCSSLTSATFTNTSGWYVTKTEGAESGTDLTSSDLTNTSKAATYLIDTYISYYWYYNKK